MVDLALLQSVSYIAGALGVCIAAIYYVYNMKTTLQTRQTQLFMEIYKTDESQQFNTIWWEVMYIWNWADYDDFMKKYSVYSGDPAPYGKLISIFYHYEGIGVLIKRGLLKLELVYDINNNSIVMFWERFLPLVREWRVRLNSPQMWEPVELLYGEMKRLQVGRGHGFDSSEQDRQFIGRVVISGDKK